MPYMQKPNSDVDTYYGCQLVKNGAVVLIDENDVAALMTEGWTLFVNSSTEEEEEDNK